MHGYGCLSGYRDPIGVYLGQDDGSTPTLDSTDISGAISATDAIDTSNIALLSQPGGPLAAGGVLDPSASDQVSVQDLQTYVNTGQASSPAVASQLASIVTAAGPAITGILQQVQFGQLAANTPISQLAALKAAITGNVSGTAVLASMTSNPALLIGIGVLLFMMFRGGSRD